MSKDFTYDEIFQRNIGLISKTEQKKIRNAKILIVGAGGIGGWSCEFLCRLGFENFIIADPESFEVSNINRQAQASLPNIDVNKAEAVGRYLKDINPNSTTEIVTEGINGENIESLVSRVDFVIDTIDFYAIDEEIILHDFCRKHRKPVFLAQVAGSKATFTNFSPTDPGLDTFVYTNNKFDMGKSIKFFFPELPAESGKFLLDRIRRGDKAVIPSYSVKPVITAALLVEDVLGYVTKNKFVHTPYIGIYDFKKRQYKTIKRVEK